MNYIREVGGRKYHIANPDMEGGIMCRKKRLKAVQLSIVVTPPPGNGLSQVLSKAYSEKSFSKTREEEG
jgi:hypothetical protein